VEVGPEELPAIFEIARPHLNERQWRVVASACPPMPGHGGKSAAAHASGMSRNTVIKAESEVESGIEPSEPLEPSGGGDRPLIDKQPGLLEALDTLVHPDTRGNPMSFAPLDLQVDSSHGRCPGPRVSGLCRHGFRADLEVARVFTPGPAKEKVKEKRGPPILTGMPSSPT
jgi:hypothetical protein